MLGTGVRVLRASRRRWVPYTTAVVLLLGCALLAIRQPAASDPVTRWRSTAPPAFHPPPTRRILFIILDAWRRKVALDDARMPRLAELGSRRSRGPVWTGPRTLTKACVRELLTGRPSSFGTATRNLVSDPVIDPSLLTRLNEAKISYRLIDVIEDLGGLFAAQSPEGSAPQLSAAGLPWDPADPAHDAVAEAAAREALKDSHQRLVIVHLESLDLGGHIAYPDTEAYDRVLSETDERIGRIRQSLDLHRDTLFVIGDHGTDDYGHHGGPDPSARETAYLAAGAGIRPGLAALEPLDVADTLAALLNICPPDGSHGAPDPQILSLDASRLKAHCDECLRSRLLAAGRDSSSSETRAYFASTTFTPAVASAYKQLVASPTGRTWPTAALALALAAVGAGLWLSRESALGLRGAWLLPAGIGVLSVFVSRDAIAVFGFAALLLWRTLRGPKIRAAVAATLAAALVLGWTATLPGVHFGASARVAGTVALFLCAALATLRALRAPLPGSAAWLSATPVAAALAARLFPTDQIPGRFSPGVVLVDYALAAGALFLVMGWAQRNRAVTALAALAIASCFFQGWALAVVSFTALLPVLRGGTDAALPAPANALWPVLGALALLRAVNGGYGFARIDLSLSVVGTRWEGTPDYFWGAAMILASYALPVTLAVLARPSADPIRPARDAIMAAFVTFAGMDLLRLTLSTASTVSRIPLEEAFVFDLVLGLLAAAAGGIQRVLDIRAARPATTGRYRFSDSAVVSGSG